MPPSINIYQATVSVTIYNAYLKRQSLSAINVSSIVTAMHVTPTVYTHFSVLEWIPMIVMSVNGRKVADVVRELPRRGRFPRFAAVSNVELHQLLPMPAVGIQLLQIAQWKAGFQIPHMHFTRKEGTDFFYTYLLRIYSQ